MIAPATTPTTTRTSAPEPVSPPTVCDTSHATSPVTMAARAMRPRLATMAAGVDAAHLHREHVEGEHGGHEVGDGERPRQPGHAERPDEDEGDDDVERRSRTTLMTNGVRVSLWA